MSRGAGAPLAGMRPAKGFGAADHDDDEMRHAAGGGAMSRGAGAPLAGMRPAKGFVPPTAIAIVSIDLSEAAP